MLTSFPPLLLSLASQLNTLAKMKRKTTEDFIERANKVHNGKYDYSKVEYNGVEHHVEIICPIHGAFNQTPHSHLKGHGCPKCGGVFMDTDYFIEKATKIYGDKYDYSRTVYVDSKTPVEIICKRHGSFFSTVHTHLRGSGGCYKCNKIDNRRLILGVGKNDVDTFMNHDRSCILWNRILARCYNPKILKKKHTYLDVSVCDEWHYFSNFLKWYREKEKWHKAGWHLDKDILVKGNKVYSPDTCCFVPHEINIIFTNSKCKRGENPIGVSFIKSKNKFMATVAINGKNKTLGHFNNKIDAFYAYKSEKEKRIKEVADKYKEELEPRVYEALYNYQVEITD